MQSLVSLPGCWAPKGRLGSTHGPQGDGGGQTNAIYEMSKTTEGGKIKLEEQSVGEPQLGRLNHPGLPGNVQILV